MSRYLRALVLAAAMAAVWAVPAGAHQGNPNYRSVIDRVSPTVPGVKLQVLGFDSQFQLTNRSNQTVTVFGYDGEPYARILANGTVEQNHLSPATYINVSDFATVAPPKFTNPKAPPQWRVVDKTGSFIWHDHRMHWMGANLPAAGEGQAQEDEGLRLPDPPQRRRAEGADQRHAVLGGQPGRLPGGGDRVADRGGPARHRGRDPDPAQAAGRRRSCAGRGAEPVKEAW